MSIESRLLPVITLGHSVQRGDVSGGEHFFRAAAEILRDLGDPNWKAVQIYGTRYDDPNFMADRMNETVAVLEAKYKTL